MWQTFVKRVQFTEEEMALFDILTKPEPVLTKVEEAQAKKICDKLPATSSGKCWCSLAGEATGKAAVMQTLKLQMRRLTARYSKDIRTEKMARAYAHVYDHCYGAGRSAYQQPVS